MKNYFLFITVLLTAHISLAQVGIGTTSPESTLDIRSSNQATPSNDDGILIPKIDEFPVVNPTAAKDGLMVYVTGIGTPSKGFYFWDQSTTAWINIKGVEKIDDLIDGRSDSDGSDDGSSIFLGVRAGQNDDSTNNTNIGIGFDAMQDNTSGEGNIAVGINSLFYNTVGGFNTAVGTRSMEHNVNGHENVAIGTRSLNALVDGIDNVAVGRGALSSVVNGSGNVAIGYNAGFAESGNNKLYIDNGYSPTPFIYGEFDNSLLQINGTLDINGAYQFPISAGSTGQVLANNGSGQLIWQFFSDVDDDSINNLSDGKTNLNEDSIFLGSQAGQNDTGSTLYNIGIGPQALRNNTNGEQNVALGNRTLFSNDSGNNNVAIGDLSMYYNTSGSNNIAIGRNTLISNTTGSYNTALGYYSLQNNEDGAGNIAVGSGSLYENISGNDNVAVGSNSMRLNDSGINNSAFGTSALYNNTAGNLNLALGRGALRENSTGSSNVAVGSYALRDNLADENVAVGSYSLWQNTTGNSNTAVGTYSLGQNVIGENNTALGFRALRTNNADSNTAIGYQSMYFNSTGEENVAIGSGTMFWNTTGDYNVAVGHSVLYDNTIGIYNVGVGRYALINNTEGSANVAIGNGALNSNISGNRNSALGGSALSANNGDHNVAIGSFSLSSNSSGDFNTVLGYNAGSQNLTGSLNVFLGYRSGFNETGSNRLYIENSTADSNNALIYGEFDNNLVRLNGRTEITSTTDASGIAGTGALEIGSALRLDGNEIITNTNAALFVQADNNGDFDVDGSTLRVDASTNRVGIRTNTPDSPLSVNGEANLNEDIATGVALRVNGSEALWYNGTYFSWGFGGSANYFADNVGVSTATPVTRLQVAGNLDTSLANHGLFVLGNVTGTNISMDGNEILARNNGGTSDLNLQIDGGNVRVGGALVHTSDMRMKRDIEDLPYGLKEIELLEPKQYNWKNREIDNFKSFGLLAQDLQAIMPELVIEQNDAAKTLSVNYTELIPVLINAVKEQDDKINKLEKELEYYKKLEERVLALETNSN